MYGNEELLKEFIQKGGCMFCSSQRCDASPLWADGCKEYRAFVDAHTVAKTNRQKGRDETSV